MTVTNDARAKPRPAAGDRQLQLDLVEPRPQAYRAASKPPGARLDIRLWVARLTTAGMLVSLGVLLYVVIFTNPARSENVLAFLATLGFGTTFALWSMGYWIRVESGRVPKDFRTGSLTRQALLGAAGVLALAILALNHLATVGAAILTGLVVIAAELLLRRLPVRL